MKSTVLVTGTGGFVFSNFIRRAIHNETKARFVSIDRIRENQTLNNVYTNKNHKFYIGDVSIQHFVDTIFEIEKPTVIIHGAAENNTDIINSNVQGTQCLINAALKHNAKFILVSTTEVYGQLNPQDQPWAENSSLNPTNLYSASKASAELLTKAAGYTNGLTYNIVRPANNYGPRQNSGKLIPKIIRNILNNEQTALYGQGLQSRDWLHVFDNCDAIIKIMEDGKPNETYNIGANQEFQNIEVYQTIANYLGKGHDLLQFVQDVPGHDFRYALDSSKLKFLGWNSQIKFKEGIKSTIDWYMSNQWWFRGN